MQTIIPLTNPKRQINSRKQRNWKQHLAVSEYPYDLSGNPGPSVFPKLTTTWPTFLLDVSLSRLNCVKAIQGDVATWEGRWEEMRKEKCGMHCNTGTSGTDGIWYKAIQRKLEGNVYELKNNERHHLLAKSCQGMPRILMKTMKFC